MFTLIGKTYSLETKRVRNFLDEHRIIYEYVDLELHPNANHYLNWIKAYKITAIPIFKTPDNAFYIGDNLSDLDAFIKRHSYQV